MKGLGALLLLAAVAAAIFLLTQSGDDPDRATQRESDVVADGGLEGGEEGGAQEPDDESKAPAPKLLELGGVVKCGDQPVPGARIRVYARSQSQDRGSPFQFTQGPFDKEGPESAVSGEDGRFLLKVPDTDVVMLVTERTGYEVDSTYVVPRPPSRSLEIHLIPGTPIVVEVRKPDATPVAGAVVSVKREHRHLRWHWVESQDERTTDKKGIARFSGFRPGDLTIRASHPDFAPAIVTEAITGTDPQHVLVTLDQGASIEGKVIAPNDAPVAGARVYVVDAKDRVVQTKPDGTFVLSRVEVGQVKLRAESAAHGPGVFGEELGWGEAVPIRTHPGRTVSGIVIRLGNPTFAVGRVLDPDGKPLPNVRCQVHVADAWERGQRTAQTDETGAYRIGPLTLGEPGRVRVSFRHEAFHVPPTKPVNIAPGKTADLGTSRAEAFGVIKGIVRDAEGVAVKGGRVTCQVTRNRSFANPVTAEGRFMLTKIPAGVVHVHAVGVKNAPYHSKKMRVEVKAGETVEIEIRAETSKLIAGTVKDTAGKPRRWVHVVLVDPEAASPYPRETVQSAHTNEDGTFRFQVPAGEYKIGLAYGVPGGLALQETPAPRVVDAGVDGLLFEVPTKGGTFKGKVIAKSDGKPVADFSVMLFRYEGLMPRGYSFPNVKVLEGGRFVAEVDEAGRYAVEILSKGFASLRTRVHTLEVGAEVDIGTIQLGAAGTVYGVVKDFRGKPVPFTRMHVLSPKLETNQTTPFTDQDGRYEVKGVAPGSYTLFAVSPRHPLAMVRDVEVKEGQRVEANVDFQAAAPLTIVVKDDLGSPVPDAVLVYTFDPIRPINSRMVGHYEPPGFGSNRSDAQGLIHKPYLPAGRVSISVEKQGYRTERRDVQLKRTQPTRIEVQLLPR